MLFVDNTYEEFFMKKLVFIFLISLSSLAYSGEWKVIAETSKCDEKIQILGKEGEKYVKALNGGLETKLFPKDGSAFHEDSMKMTEFVSDKKSDIKYTFTQPSYVDGNPPKMDVAFNGNKKRCNMNLAR
jgi:hypothetical protein